MKTINRHFGLTMRHAFGGAWGASRFRFTKLALFAVVAVSFLLGAPVQASLSVTFTAGNATVAPATAFGISITCNDFTAVSSYQYSLSWDPAILQYNSLDSFGIGNVLADFGTDFTLLGKLGVTWDPQSGKPESYANGTTVFRVNFTSIGAEGSSSLIHFGDDPTAPELIVNDLPASFDFHDGNVTVSAVPEPINIALLSFAGVMAMVGGLRWAKSRFSRP